MEEPGLDAPGMHQRHIDGMSCITRNISHKNVFYKITGK